MSLRIMNLSVPTIVKNTCTVCRKKEKNEMQWDRMSLYNRLKLVDTLIQHKCILFITQLMLDADINKKTQILL